jgi:site-specific recombinase XerD
MESKIHTFTLLFYLRKVKTDSHGNAPVYTRVTVNGQRAEFSISRSINAQRWNSKGQKVKGNSEDSRTLNTYIDTVRTKLYEEHKKLIEGNKLVTAVAIRNGYLGITEKKLSLLEAIDYHNREAAQKVNIDFAPATIARYITLINHVKDFLKYKYRTSDIYLTQLNYKFITDFESYLKTVRLCNHNSTIKYIRNLRKIINIALANDWLQKDPFVKFKGSVNEVEREILTQEDLKAIEEKQFSIPRLEQVKDTFVFACYTGLAYSDVSKLTPEHIQLGIDGQKWIYTHRTKTETKSNVPLLPAALNILEKYSEHPECKITGKLLPVISNQKLNSYLKEIADLCGIRKNLTFHIARHTFATTVTLTNGVPIESVSTMLGHKNIRTTQIYAKVVERKVSEDMNLLKQRLQKNASNTTSTKPIQRIKRSA